MSILIITENFTPGVVKCFFIQFIEDDFLEFILEGESPRGVVVKLLDCDHEVNEFEL